jgi:hypothetical protein
MTKSPYLGGGFGCAGGMTMSRYQKRLQRLEAALPRWPASVEQAKQRCLARVHLRIGEALGRMDEPLVLKAQALLTDDTPEQRVQDLDTLQRWSRAHPELSRGSEGARDRISARLDELARRMEAHDHEPIP